jgi:hypothetical protein
VRYLDPPPPGQVPVEMELLLQLQRLVTGVRLPTAFPFWNTTVKVRSYTQ